MAEQVPSESGKRKAENGNVSLSRGRPTKKIRFPVLAAPRVSSFGLHCSAFSLLLKNKFWQLPSVSLFLRIFAD